MNMQLKSMLKPSWPKIIVFVCILACASALMLYTISIAMSRMIGGGGSSIASPIDIILMVVLLVLFFPTLLLQTMLQLPLHLLLSSISRSIFTILLYSTVGIGFLVNLAVWYFIACIAATKLFPPKK